MQCSAVGRGVGRAFGWHKALALSFLIAVPAVYAQEAPSGDGSTPLHWAAYRDDLAKVDQLLRAGANVNAANDLGVTPLWAASLNGSVTLVKRLLDAGANPNAALLSGETSLMVAARAGKTAVVEELLRKGANPNARGTRGQTALMWAVAQKHAEVVKALIFGHADLNARSESWEQMMAVPPHGLPEYNRMIPQGGDTALMFAARVGDLASAKLLVEAGGNPSDHDAWGVSATTLAVFAGNGEVARFLLEKGADPNNDKPGFTALHCAIMRRDTETVAALLARGADPNVTVKVWTATRRASDDYHFMPALVGASPYWLAARFTQPDVMRLLVKHGADPKVVHQSNYVQGEGYQRRQERTTAVMAALGMGGGVGWIPIDRAQRDALVLETVKVAVELGGDVNTTSTDGRTALDSASAQKYDAVVAFLKERGAMPGTGGAPARGKPLAR
jgi:ankyrin repeat protein